MDSQSQGLPACVLVVAGPTAAGKTEFAAALARELDAEVVGADSRQVYRYMDVGTAKPSLELRDRIRHHMVDVADPDEDFDVARWRDGAMVSLRDIHRRGRRAIVCGGTGLYLRSLTRGLFPGPAADPDLRARLEAEERERPGCLHERLRNIDPELCRRVHPNDLVRTVRGLEVHALTGRRLSAWQAEHGLGDRPFDVLTMVVTMATDALDERILKRSEIMVADDIVGELRGLHARGYPPDARAFAAIGYREARQCLDGEIPVSELAAAIALSTRRYAKRQRTWLRGEMRHLSETRAIVDVAPDETAGALALAESFFS